MSRSCNSHRGLLQEKLFPTGATAFNASEASNGPLYLEVTALTHLQLGKC